MSPLALLIAVVDAALNTYHLACHPAEAISTKETP